MAYLIALLAFIGVLGGTAFKSYEMGRDSVIADNAKTEALITKVRDDAKLGAADAIAKIEIKQVTIQGRLQKEIQTNTVYRDCVHSPDGMRSINDALTNTDSGPSSGGQLPASSPAK